MNRTETLQILAVLRGAYPAFYRGMGRTEADRVTALWTEMFAQDDAALVAAAVKTLIATDTREFPPLIGTVKEQLRRLCEPEALTEAEAWGLVAKAVRNGLYGAAEEFAKLPESVQQLVGSPSQLRAWAEMDSTSLHSVVASNFQRSYKAVVKRRQEAAKLPESVKARLVGIGGGSEE